MPKKTEDVDTETAVTTPVETAVTPAGQVFFFPSVGNGVSILASSFAEAQEKIKSHPLHVSA